MRVAVLSSVYGDYDHVSQPCDQTIPADWILVSDRDYGIHPWKPVIEPRLDVHPRLAAKVAKCRPELYADADAYVWVDASFRITHPEFLAWCVAHLDDGPMAQIPHPDRQHILDEAYASTGAPKYTNLPVVAQAQSYIAAGYPDGWGLWATGLIVYDGPSRIGDLWLGEQVRWTYQDQISEPPLLYASGIRPVDMAGGLVRNPYFQLGGHRSHL